MIINIHEQITVTIPYKCTETWILTRSSWSRAAAVKAITKQRSKLEIRVRTERETF